MHDIQVTDAGYEFLARTGLEARIARLFEEDELKELMPYSAFFDREEIEDLLKRKMPKARRTAIEKFLASKKGETIRQEDLFLVSGAATGAILSKKESANSRQFDVSLPNLDTLIAAYCLARREENPFGDRKPYVWRANGFKTIIYGDVHGDLHLHQIQTRTLPAKETTLEGATIAQLFGNLSQAHIGVDYSYWPYLVAVALKYASTVGLEIPEINNWQQFLRLQDWNGTISAPSGTGIGYEYFVSDWNAMELAQLPDKVDKLLFGQIYYGKLLYLPVIGAQQGLVIYSSQGTGAGTEFVVHGKRVTLYPMMYSPKSDAHHLFKGAVHGIMTNQSRTNPELLAFMLWQYEQIKSGISEDDIRKASRQFERRF